jgi:hypothetical protein
MKPPHTALLGDNRATWATAFEAAPLTKPPALRGVSDLLEPAFRSTASYKLGP